MSRIDELRAKLGDRRWKMAVHLGILPMRVIHETVDTGRSSWDEPSEEVLCGCPMPITEDNWYLEDGTRLNVGSWQSIVPYGKTERETSVCIDGEWKVVEVIEERHLRAPDYHENMAKGFWKRPMPAGDSDV